MPVVRWGAVMEGGFAENQEGGLESVPVESL